jgi:hypothetical protein
LIAQYVEDVLRCEGQNVGIIARRGSEISAQFAGERGSGEFDNRVLRRFAAPDVYKQWVTYWRALMADAEHDAFETIYESQRPNFPILRGGFVGDTDDDRLEMVINYLYPLLVGEGGYREALGINVEGADSAASLDKEMEEAFDGANILARDRAGNVVLPPLVRHPVQRRPKLRGESAAAYRPSYSQDNGRLYVMEPVDFALQGKERARDHAGYAAFMFEDLRRGEIGERLEAIALVSVSPTDESESLVKDGLAMLRSRTSHVVNWLDPKQRVAFLQERQRIATA